MGKIPDDPRFRHVNYRHTDVSKTFARERKRLAELKAARDAEEAAARAEAEATEAEAVRKVRKIGKGAA